MSVASAIDNYVPDFADEKLTRKFEEDLEKLIEGKMKKEKIIDKAKQALVKISDEFKKNEDKIGKELGDAIVKTQENESIIGPCPNCGKSLKRMYSPKTRKYFVGCSGYKEGCKTAYPLPRNAKIQRLDKICDKCKTPIIKVIRKGRRPFNMCLDPDCETKSKWGKKK
jgi:DNA topoisomerase-1